LHRRLGVQLAPGRPNIAEQDGLVACSVDNPGEDQCGRNPTHEKLQNKSGKGLLRELKSRALEPSLL